MLIPYLGEKSKFASFILPNIPKDISTYVEPFGGMFGIFFSLNFDKMNEDINYVYNDQNYLNYNLFQFLQNEKFISLPHIINNVHIWILGIVHMGYSR